MKRHALVLFPVGLLLAACGGGSDAAVDASDVATDLESEVSSITKTIEITEGNDPNDRLGRPGSYQQAVVLHDSRAECLGSEELGIDCGAKIEVFADEDAAQERMEYIQAIVESGGALVSEYDYLDGAVLLRVSGQLTPSEAAEYEQAFLESSAG